MSEADKMKELGFVDPPNCESCPYWDPTEDDVDENDEPVERKQCVTAHQAVWKDKDGDLKFPCTWSGDTCSKHPDYQTWIEEQYSKRRTKRLLKKVRKDKGKSEDD